MNKFKKLALSTLLLASTPFAAATAFLGSDFYVNPYVAAELASRNMSWETDFGKGHFRQQAPNVNFIFGVQFHDYFAVEGGFQATDRRQQQSFYHGDGPLGGNFAAPVLGFIDDPVFDPKTHHAESEIKGWHLNLVGILPVLPTTSLYASIGAAWMQFDVSTVATTANLAAQPIARWNSGNTAVFRAGVGVKQMITEHFGARAFYNWEGTNRLDVTTPEPLALQNAVGPLLPTDFYRASSKASHLFGLGFFYQLCPNKTA
ncbi:MAG: outer membrane protein [Candidatus Berkiella sp.]